VKLRIHDIVSRCLAGANPPHCDNHDGPRVGRRRRRHRDTTTVITGQTIGFGSVQTKTIVTGPRRVHERHEQAHLPRPQLGRLVHGPPRAIDQRHRLRLHHGRDVQLAPVLQYGRRRPVRRSSRTARPSRRSRGHTPALTGAVAAPSGPRSARAARARRDRTSASPLAARAARRTATERRRSSATGRRSSARRSSTNGATLVNPRRAPRERHVQRAGRHRRVHIGGMVTATPRAASTSGNGTLQRGQRGHGLPQRRVRIGQRVLGSSWAMGRVPPAPRRRCAASGRVRRGLPQCVPSGGSGCVADGDCTAGQFCNGSTNTCTAKLANGVALVNPRHAARQRRVQRAGRPRSVQRGASVTRTNACGFANNDGACTPGNAGTVCRTGACAPTRSAVSRSAKARARP